MEEKEFNTTFAIPANYTDSGKIFGGMLEPRNAVEALILILAVGYPELMLIKLSFSGFLFPAFLFAELSLVIFISHPSQMQFSSVRQIADNVTCILEQ